MDTNNTMRTFLLLLLFLAQIVSTNAIAENSTPSAAVEAFLKDQSLVEKNLLSAESLWQDIDDSELQATYRRRWKEIRPNVKFNNYGHDQFSILKMNGDFIIASVTNPKMSHPTYLLFQVKKGTNGAFRVLPGHFSERWHFINPFLASVGAMIRRDETNLVTQDYLQEYCATTPATDTKTARSIAVSAFLSDQALAYAHKKNTSKLWSHFDISELVATRGKKQWETIKAQLKFEGYSHDSFSIEGERGNFVIARVLKSTWTEQSPHYLLFHVKKGTDGAYKITPGFVDEPYINPWLVDLDHVNSNDDLNFRFFEYLDRYCAALKS